PPPPGFAAPARPTPPSAMPPPVPGTGVSGQFTQAAPVPMLAAVPAPVGRLQIGPPAVYLRPDKSLGLTYLLWLLLGIFGVHHFYLGKWQRGLLYLLTGGLLMIGLLVDLFTLPWQVKRVNAERRAGPR